MNLESLNFLPEWEDEKFNDADGEGWKMNAITSAGKALYLLWRELFGSILAFTENICNDPENSNLETHEQLSKKLIYENAIIVAPKIISATRVIMYILQMENAAIIRTNCRQLMEQIGFAVLMGFGDESHKEVIEEEMNSFRVLFKNWIDCFKKDEWEDEWGLFI